MAQIIIYGAGSMGQQVLQILRQRRQHHVIAFVDRDPQKTGTSIDDIPVYRRRDDIPSSREMNRAAAIVAIGDNRVRTRMADRLRNSGVHLLSAIDPTASIARSAFLHQHVIICSRANICVHATIQRDTIIRTGAIVEHDNMIGRGVFLAPAVRLAGGVMVDDGATVGIGASVIPGRRIHHDATVAPGAVVIRDVPPCTHVSGAPARPIQDSAITKQASRDTASATPAAATC